MRLLWCSLPVATVLVVTWRWGMGYRASAYAVFRMLLQLLLVGYALAFIFESNSATVVILVLSVMLVAASWIALRAVTIPRTRLLFRSLGAVGLAGGSILIITTHFVLGLEPWYLPTYVIPLAGMIFANAMNSVTLAGERLEAELRGGTPFATARTVALGASLIPITNSLLAVGLVSTPGMMTGQILAGVSPFIAARYQIMIMCMVFGAAGIASALFLRLVGPILAANHSSSGHVDPVPERA